MDLLTTLSQYVNVHLLTAAALGAAIGLEREISGKDPSLRTFALISLGSCIFTMVSVEAVDPGTMGDRTRIAAQIVTGIGFIGAGAIFRSETRVNGLTTAALMWCTAAIGMAVGIDRFDIAVSATLVALLCTFGLRIVHKLIGYLRKETSGPSAVSSPFD